MNSILAQLSIAVGGIVFVLALVAALLNGVPMLAAILRAATAMCISSVLVALFFRYFTNILYRFVADRIQVQAKAQPEAATPSAKPGAPKPPGPPRPSARVPPGVTP